MVRLGYACINTKLPAPNRTCRLRNATPERILELASANLAALKSVLRWNVSHRIELFRITSDVVPFGSHPVNTTAWPEILGQELAQIGTFIRDRRLRVSMHPGQFTVLNSPRAEVVANSIKELEYHTRFLDALGIDGTHKIVIHLGGVYENKKASLKRFVESARALAPSIKARLVIENDERCFSVADTLEVSEGTGLPVVFDAFHHVWNPALEHHSMRSIILRATKTWRKRDGRVKIHYSNQWPGQPPGTHSRSISVRKFLPFFEELRDLELDIMLEVKDKQESVLKLRQALLTSRHQAARDLT